MDIKEVNKIMSKACGVFTRINNVEQLCYRIGEGKQSHFEEWSVEDDRCRKIIRVRFQLTTETDGVVWLCNSFKVEYVGCGEYLKDLDNAEISCITAIAEMIKEAQHPDISPVNL